MKPWLLFPLYLPFLRQGTDFADHGGILHRALADDIEQSSSLSETTIVSAGDDDFEKQRFFKRI